MPQSTRKKYYKIAKLQLFGPDLEPQYVFENWVKDYPEIENLYKIDKLKITSNVDEVMTVEANFTEKEFLIWRLKNSHWLEYER